MMPVRFDKQRATYFVECLNSGTAIRPDEGVWNKYEMLSLAGALYFACLSQGPVAPEQLGSLVREHQEAVEESFITDLKAAVEFCGMLTAQVVDQDYDESFESTVEALLSSVDGETTVRPVSGFKGV